MASLLSIQYVTPSHANSSSSHEPTIRNSSSIESDSSLYKVRIIPMNSVVDYYHQMNTLNVISNDKSTTAGVSNVTAIKFRAPLNNDRLAYVDALVDANALVIESIWQLTINKFNNSTISNDNNSNNVVPLRTFIQEVLKRSRTTYSTLQTALFYLFRSKPEIEVYLSKIKDTRMSNWEDAYVSCGRRMFLASLVVASKFVQDKTYRNSAWAKIAGLSVSEVNIAERIFLGLINYRLYINQITFEKWHHLLHRHVEAKTMNRPTNLQDFSCLLFAASNDFQSNYSHGSQQKATRNKKLKTNNQNPAGIFETPTSLHIPSPHTPRSNTNNNSSFVFSPSALLPPPKGISNIYCDCTKQRTGKRKRNNNNSINFCCHQLQQQKQRNLNRQYYIQPPILSSSLPSSNNSSPTQTPTQISPIRINNGSSVYNWNSPTSFDHNVQPRPTYNSGNNKKRKISKIDTHLRSNIISNVRQQPKRFYS